MPVSAGLFYCTGAERKCNWLLVRHAPESKRCIVFFPGDLSDFAAGAGLPYSYSLEALFWVLCCKFPEDTLVLVKPRMLVEHFAIYVNFMLVDGTGNPRPLSELRPSRDSDDAQMGEECQGQQELEGDNPPTPEEAAAAETAAAAQPLVEPPRAVLHLERLLVSAGVELGGDLPPRLTLVGFSKGASVLGALLREARTEAEFWGRVDAVHFVDAGLTVPGSIFPVGPEELQALKTTACEGFAIWLHGTPRQWEDPARPFVAEETHEFAQRCQAAGLKVERRWYGVGLAPNLNLHFDSLRCFCTGSASDVEESGDSHCGFFAAWTEAAGA